jgi:toxin ParE1/3/4
VTRKTLSLTNTARQEVAEAIAYYRREGGNVLANRFISALETTVEAIKTAPHAGSPRYTYELNLLNLRQRLVRRFPYLVFYIEYEDRIEIWRVLHAQRDIPTTPQEDGDDDSNRRAGG